MKCADCPFCDEHDPGYRVGQLEARVGELVADLGRLTEAYEYLLALKGPSVKESSEQWRIGHELRELTERIGAIEAWQRRQVGEINTDVIALLRAMGARLDALEGRSSEKETHGSSENTINAKPYVGVTDHFCAGGQYIYPSCQACQAHHPRSARPDPSPAEPGDAQGAGAEPPPAGPERTD